MKKIKFNAKLTFSLVSLFIGLILVILGNKNKYCLGFGLMCLGVGSFLYSLYKTDANKQLQKEVEQELNNYNPENQEDVAVIKELKRIENNDLKQTRRINVSFVMFGILMFVLGIVVCI